MNITATLKNINAKTGIGTVYIYIDLYSKTSRTRIFYQTSHKVDSKSFEAGRVKGRTDVAKSINSKIESEIEEIKGIVNQLKNDGKDVTKEALINARNAKNEVPKSLVDLIHEYIQFKTVTSEPKLIEKLKNLVVRLEDFQLGRMKEKETFNYPNQINQNFVNLFTAYLQKERPSHPNKRLRKSQSPATISKTFGFLRQALHHFFQLGIVSDSYKNLKYPKAFTQKQMVLVESEIKQLINFQPPNKRLEKVKDLALLQLFTGLRYSDAVKVNQSNFYNGNLNITAKKTKQKIEVPIHPALSDLLEKYKGDFKGLKISNVKYNDYLKELLKLAGIASKAEYIYFINGKESIELEFKYDLVSSHTFRRTFITNAILKGISLHVIQSITGHATLKQLSEYVNIADEIKKSEINKLNSLFSNE
jgi:integrase